MTLVVDTVVILCGIVLCCCGDVSGCRYCGQDVRCRVVCYWVGDVCVLGFCALVWCSLLTSAIRVCHTYVSTHAPGHATQTLQDN